MYRNSSHNGHRIALCIKTKDKSGKGERLKSCTWGKRNETKQTMKQNNSSCVNEDMKETKTRYWTKKWIFFRNI